MIIHTQFVQGSPAVAAALRVGEILVSLDVLFSTQCSTSNTWHKCSLPGTQHHTPKSVGQLKACRPKGANCGSAFLGSILCNVIAGIAWNCRFAASARTTASVVGKTRVGRHDGEPYSKATRGTLRKPRQEKSTAGKNPRFMARPAGAVGGPAVEQRRSWRGHR